MADKWEAFQQASTVLHHIFSHLNRHYVQRLRGDGHRDVYPIKELAFRLWHKKVQSSEKVNDAIENLMERERNGEVIDPELKSKLSCFAKCERFSQFFNN